MNSPLPAGRLGAWRAYYASFWRILAAIEAELAAAGLPSLSWYDALYELYLAPGRQLRMNELARCALLSRSGLTRLVDRLEKEKLIERRVCPTDGRVLHARLTDKGVALLRRIWPVYRAGIARHFSAQLSDPEAAQVERAMGKVLAGLEPPGPDAA